MVKLFILAEYIWSQNSERNEKISKNGIYELNWNEYWFVYIVKWSPQ